MGRLVCTNFNETRFYTVKVGDQEAIFELGVIPRDIKMKCQRLIDIDVEGQLEAVWLAAKYGVRGHKDLIYVDKEGNEQELKFVTEKDDKGRSIVIDDVLESYFGSGFLAEVSAESLQKGMGEVVKSQDTTSIINPPSEVEAADTREKQEQMSSTSSQDLSLEKTV